MTFFLSKDKQIRLSLNQLCLLASIILVCTACTSLKAYEKIYVNDPDMQMEDEPSRKFLQYTQSIREGMTPAGTPKSSGGCGCN